jgi:hypothetical protein
MSALTPVKMLEAEHRVILKIVGVVRALEHNCHRPYNLPDWQKVYKA